MFNESVESLCEAGPGRRSSLCRTQIFLHIYGDSAEMEAVSRAACSVTRTKVARLLMY